MNEDQASTLISLLGEVLSELQTMNSNLQTVADSVPLVAPVYNLDDIYSKIEDIGDQITGGVSGSGGKDLSDLNHRLEMLELSIGD